jgi:hypothetical protein
LQRCPLTYSQRRCCRSYAPKPREASQTIAWFKQRQADLDKQKASGSGGIKVPDWGEAGGKARKGAGGEAKAAGKGKALSSRDDSSSGNESGSEDEGPASRAKRKALEMLDAFRQ